MVLTKKIFPFISLLLIVFPFWVNAQGLNTTFGQNRLPYKNMDWQVLSSEEVDAFYYEGGENLGVTKKYRKLKTCYRIG